MPDLPDYYYFTDAKITQHIMNKTKKLFTTIGLVLDCMITVSAQEAALSLIQNVQAYESLSLNGEWNYIVDVQEEGYYDYRMNPTRWGFFQNAKPQRPEDLIEYDFDKSPTMQIPSDWNTQDERLFFYEGTVWFKKSFQAVPVQDYRTLLYFGAVNYDCHVWVNGRKAGHHIGGFTPFNFDISDLLKAGENVVIVKVDNKRHAEDVPTQIFDWWNYGGITRDVKLVKVTPVYLEDYSLQLVKADAKAKQCEISFSARLNKKESGHKVCVFIPELKLEQQLITDAEGTVSGMTWSGLSSNIIFTVNDGSGHIQLSKVKVSLAIYDPQPMEGDVNSDGSVDVADIATIIDVMAGHFPENITPGTDPNLVADVNGDGSVDVADIASVISIMAGETPSEGE